MIPLRTAIDSCAGQPDGERGVEGYVEEALQVAHHRVGDRSDCVAAVDAPSVTLARIDGRVGGTIAALHHWSDRRDDAAHRSEDDGQRNEALAEHHCEG